MTFRMRLRNAEVLGVCTPGGIHPFTNISVVSMDPGYRSLIVPNMDDGIFRRGKSKAARLPFPYLHFGFRYSVVPGGYRYPGLSGYGLCVFLSRNPLNFGEEIYFCPTDERSPAGVVCTDHRWDNHVFKTPELLMGNIMNLWWNTFQVILTWPIKPCFESRYEQVIHHAVCEWENLSLEKAMVFPWNKLPLNNVADLFLQPDIVEKFIDEPVGNLLRNR